MRSLIDDEDQESEPSTVGLSPDNNADIFLGVEDAAIDLQELQPECVMYFLDKSFIIIKYMGLASADIHFNSASSTSLGCGNFSSTESTP